MKKPDYEKDVEIGLNLIEEWQKQAPLFLYYSRETAKLEKECEIAKEGMEVIKAELDAQIRENPSQHTKVPKLTETLVSNIIIQNNTYREAQSKYIDSKFEAAIGKIVPRAFEHKKKALEYISMLEMSGLYAEPNEKQPQQMLKRGRSKNNRE